MQFDFFLHATTYFLFSTISVDGFSNDKEAYYKIPVRSPTLVWTSQMAFGVIQTWIRMPALCSPAEGLWASALQASISSSR